MGAQVTAATRTVSVSAEPLPCGRRAARDLQWYGQAIERLSAGVPCGPRPPVCLLGVLAETVPREEAPAPDPARKPRTVADMLASRSTAREDARAIEAALVRVQARNATWCAVLKATYVTRRNADDVHTVLYEVGMHCAPVEMLVVWHRLKTAARGQVEKWTRDRLTEAVAAYDEEVTRA